MVGIIIFGTLFVGALCQDPVAYLTPDQTLIGNSTYWPGSNVRVNAFYGVPFAAPPIGDLRWRPPIDPPKWNGIRYARKIGDACLQSRIPLQILQKGQQKSEDCLYLDIYTPTLDRNARLYVMFWIHGGALQYGTGSIFNGAGLAALHNVVVVTINYRLGLYGFFTSGDSTAPGNYGLYDQVKGMQWVKENIQAFGGDPNKVVIFGESAGSWSVNSHLLSPISRGYFMRAISQSGAMSYINPPSYIKNTGQAPGNLAVAHHAGCNMTNLIRLVHCLRSKPASILTAAEKMAAQAGAAGHGPIPRFKYVVDGEFFPSAKKTTYSKVPYLAGVCRDEGGGSMANELFPAMSFNPLSYALFESEIRKYFRILYDDDEDAVGKITAAVVKHYGGRRGMRGDEYREILTTLAGDVFIGLDTIIAAVKHAGEGLDTYFYQMEYYPRVPIRGLKQPWENFVHAEDLQYVFGAPVMVATGPTFDNQGQKNFSKTVMQYWVNFVKTGNPNGNGLLTWPKLEPRTEKYMVLSPQQKVRSAYKREARRFWLEQIPKLLKSSASSLVSSISSLTLVLVLGSQFALRSLF